jgi:outer membrane receptor protein involved in Fe transport
LSYNHPRGFLAQFQALWNLQSNQGYQPDEPGDEFWQLNAFVGYRFLHRKVEVRVGLLNLTDQDYRLEPLTLYSELPRERTFVARLQFHF